jgi:hypothetical protein
VVPQWGDDQVGIRVYWLDESHILMHEYTGMTTDEQIKETIVEDLKYLENGPASFLVDMTNLHKMPNNIMRLVQSQQILNHPNLRWMALVKPNMFIKMAVQVVRLRNFEVFDDREAAIAFLREKVAQEQGQTEQG